MRKIIFITLILFIANTVFAVSPLPGFLNGAYGKMMAQAKMVDFAKSHRPTKTTVYYGSFSMCPSTGQNSSLSGTLTVYFYSNGVIKVDGEYYIPMEDSKEGTQGYLLPVGHQLQNVRAVSLLHNNTEINYLVALENGNTRIWFVHHYNMSPSNSSNGYYNNTPYNNGSNGSSSRTCPSCRGSRNCNTCGGAGKYWEEVGQYTGNSYKKKVDCPVCYGTGRCGTCHGKGSL